MGMPEPKARQTLNVDLGELKPLVLLEAERQGRKPAALVRQAVAVALHVQPVSSTRVSARRVGGRWVAATYRLSVDEAHALLAGATADGVSQAEHVGRLALEHRAGVTRGQVLDALHGLTERLQSLELALQAGQQGPALAEALRELRTQGKRTAVMVEAMTTTRRKKA
jgi:hypothetical protein